MQKAIGKMARMFPMMIGLGFAIVLASGVIGYFNSQTAAQYFSVSKEVRETTLLSQRASFESVDLWLPYFKFLGLGLILGGIVMALRVIIDRLKAAGQQVMSNLPPEKRPAMPKAPWYGKLMPMLMMAGEAIFLVAFGVSIYLAGIARSVFSNPVPAIDAAGPGSPLLEGLQTIQTNTAWLVPLKFFGIATEFLAILSGLATIVYILTTQTKMIEAGIQLARETGRRATQPQERVEQPVPSQA